MWYLWMCLCEYSDCLIEETAWAGGETMVNLFFQEVRHWDCSPLVPFDKQHHWLVSTLHNTYSYVVEIGVGVRRDVMWCTEAVDSSRLVCHCRLSPYMYYVASLYVCVHECECVWLWFFVSTGELKHSGVWDKFIHVEKMMFCSFC